MRIITWEEAKAIYKKEVIKNHNFKVDAFVCFYTDDHNFDGLREGIWWFPRRAMKKLQHFTGIITPDFSTYQDFPYPIKLFNTFRMRAFGHWAGICGLEVINNVRWGTKETYDYCFDGLPKNSVLAIGTVGGSPKKKIDRERFEEGLIEMVKRLSPHTIIVYGSANYKCLDDLKKQGINIISFEGRTSSAYQRKKATK